MKLSACDSLGGTGIGGNMQTQGDSYVDSRNPDKLTSFYKKRDEQEFVGIANRPTLQV
jgi:hypothetical protein